PAYREIADGNFQIRPAKKEDMQRVVEAALVRNAGLTGVIFLWSADRAGKPEPSLSEIQQSQRRGCDSVLTLVQALAALDHPPQLWLITRGAQPAGRVKHMSVRQSSLWGMGRVIMNEHPRLRCRMIDLDLDRSQSEIQSLIEELDNESADEEIALRGSVRSPPGVSWQSARAWPTFASETESSLWLLPPCVRMFAAPRACFLVTRAT